MPSSVYLLLAHTRWPELSPLKQQDFLEGLAKWDFDAQETVQGVGMIESLLLAFENRETRFLNAMVSTLLDRGACPQAALEAKAASQGAKDGVRWELYPQIKNILTNHAHGNTGNDDLSLGLALLEIVSKRQASSSTLVELEQTLQQKSGASPPWAFPIQGAKAAVWLALQSVRFQYEKTGWKDAYTSQTESFTHHLRILKGILSAALREGSFSESEVALIRTAWACMGSDSSVILRTQQKAAAGALSSFLPALNTAPEALKNLVDFTRALPESLRLRASQAFLQVAKAGLASSSTNHTDYANLVPVGLSMGLDADKSLLHSKVVASLMTVWQGHRNKKEWVKGWVQDEIGIQHAIALWAGSWAEENQRSSGSLAAQNRSNWLTDVSESLHASSRGLPELWSPVKQLLDKALQNPAALEEWKPIAAALLANAMEHSLEPGRESTRKPRM